MIVEVDKGHDFMPQGSAAKNSEKPKIAYRVDDLDFVVVILFI